MMVAQRAPVAEPLTASEAIEAGVRLVVETGIPAREAATAVLMDADLAPEGSAELMRMGLIAGINRRLTDQRGTDQMASMLGRFQLNTPPAPQLLRDILTRVVLQGVDGRQKALAEFTLADCLAFQGIAAKQVTAWTTRRALMTHAAERLARTKVATVIDLPAPDLAKVRALAEKAWGGKGVSE